MPKIGVSSDEDGTTSPEMLTFVFGIVFKIKSLSNLIFKTKSNGNMFDRDFIFKKK